MHAIGLIRVLCCATAKGRKEEGRCRWGWPSGGADCAVLTVLAVRWLGAPRATSLQTTT